MCYLKLKPNYTCEWERSSMYEENFADTSFNPMELSGIAGGIMIILCILSQRIVSKKIPRIKVRFKRLKRDKLKVLTEVKT